MSRRQLLWLLCAVTFALPALPQASAQTPTPTPTPSTSPTPSESPTPRPCTPGLPDGYERLINLTFPVRGNVTYSDTYKAGRSKHMHQATDIMAAKMQTVHAVLPGVIEVATGIDQPMPSYGYYLKIRHDDGTTAAYVHLNNDTPGSDDGNGGYAWAYAPGMRKGVRVERGQWIGYVGDSGNAENTAPHLHFELEDPAMDDPCLDPPEYTDKQRLNPYASLRDAQTRNDYPPPPPVAPVTRLGGSTRVHTSVLISQQYNPGVDAVIVVPQGSPFEALLAAPLSGMLDAPILLAAPDGLDDAVAAEVRRLDTRNAYVIGTTAQLGAGVEQALRNAGIADIGRLSAADPFALSVVVARELRQYPQAPRVERVYLALGAHQDPERAWPDALSVAALAAVSKQPVLLTARDELSADVRMLLQELRPPLINVIGGSAAISEQVASDAARQAQGRVTRLSGANRFATSVAVANEAVAAGLSAPLVWFATGLAFPDALAAGPAAARRGAVLLLVDGQNPGGAPEPEGWVAGRAAQLNEGIAVGGSAAISESVRTRLGQLLGSGSA